eukprot:ANDGO_05545.mRNA.1 hypothetical protein
MIGPSTPSSQDAADSSEKGSGRRKPGNTGPARSSCESCRFAHAACNKEFPCSRCIRLNLQCVYDVRSRHPVVTSSVSTSAQVSYQFGLPGDDPTNTTPSPKTDIHYFPSAPMQFWRADGSLPISDAMPNILLQDRQRSSVSNQSTSSGSTLPEPTPSQPSPALFRKFESAPSLLLQPANTGSGQGGQTAPPNSFEQRRVQSLPENMVRFMQGETTPSRGVYSQLSGTSGGTGISNNSLDASPPCAPFLNEIEEGKSSWITQQLLELRDACIQRFQLNVLSPEELVSQLQSELGGRFPQYPPSNMNTSFGKQAAATDSDDARRDPMFATARQRGSLSLAILSWMVESCLEFTRLVGDTNPSFHAQTSSGPSSLVYQFLDPSSTVLHVYCHDNLLKYGWGAWHLFSGKSIGELVDRVVSPFGLIQDDYFRDRSMNVAVQPNAYPKLHATPEYAAAPFSSSQSLPYSAPPHRYPPYPPPPPPPPPPPLPAAAAAKSSTTSSKLTDDFVKRYFFLLYRAQMNYSVSIRRFICNTPSSESRPSISHALFIRDVTGVVLVTVVVTSLFSGVFSREVEIAEDVVLSSVDHAASQQLISGADADGLPHRSLP